jgi:hypothetical protein
VLGAALLAWLAIGGATPAAAAAATGVANGNASTRAIGAVEATDSGAAVAAPAEDYLAFADLPGAATVPARPRTSQSASREQVAAEFQRRSRCVRAAMWRRQLEDPQVSASLDRLARETPPKGNSYDLPVLELIQAGLDNVERAERECPPNDPRDTDGSIYELALRAADAGDATAARCYVSASYPMPEQMLRRPDQRERFRLNASRLLEQRITAGDWAMAELALEAYQTEREGWKVQLPRDPLEAPGVSLLMTIAPRGNPQRLYELSRLFELGAPSTKVAQGLAVRSEYTGRPLSPAQRSSGDAWARATFANAFRGQPAAEAGPAFCD